MTRKKCAHKHILLLGNGRWMCLNCLWTAQGDIMTIQPEMKFCCDRCLAEINVSLNDQPAQERNKSPEGWLALWVDSTTMPAKHLCPECRVVFEGFMLGLPR